VCASELGCLCSRRGSCKQGVVLYSTVDLAMQHPVLHSRTPYDPFTSMAQVLICRVTLRPDATFVLADASTRAPSATLTTPHKLIVFSPDCILPVWYVSLEQSMTRVTHTNGAVDSTPPHAGAHPGDDESRATAAALVSIRKLQVKAMAMKVGLRVK
jgi:hypothetical protein